MYNLQFSQNMVVLNLLAMCQPSKSRRVVIDNYSRENCTLNEFLYTQVSSSWSYFPIAKTPSVTQVMNV